VRRLGTTTVSAVGTTDSRSRLLVAAIATLLIGPAWLGLGCATDPPPPRPRVTAQRRIESPIDSVEPGELAESKVLAFGLPLPRGMRVRTRFTDTTYAIGAVSFEELSNYVRARVKAERVDTGPAKTVFLNAVLKSDKRYRLRVEVSFLGGMAELVVRDRRPKKRDNSLSDEERYEKMGVTPDLKVIRNRAE